MQQQLTISKANLILVEGVDEENFFAALNSSIDLTSIQVLPLCGKTNFSKGIKALPNLPGYSQVKKIAIFRDTDDENQEDIFRSLRDALDKAGLPRPHKLFTFTETTPKLGIFLFPGNNTPGALRRSLFIIFCREEINIMHGRLF